MARKVGQIIGRGRRTWLVRVYLGRDSATRKRRYLNKTIHGRLRDAQAYLTQKLGERNARRAADSSTLMLDQYLDRWLEICAKPRLRAKSFRDYEGLLRRYVRPQLGTRRLAAVQALDIQRLYSVLTDRGLSSRTARYTHAVLRCALKQAVRWSLLAANPAELVDLPKPARHDFTVLNIEQARAFINAIAGHTYEALFALAITTGMRPSEYLGLTWGDIDFGRGTASVSKTLEWKKGGWGFADTKRSGSRRVVKLQSWVVQLLERRRGGASLQRDRAIASDLVFATQRGRPIRESKLAQKYFKPLLKSAGLPNIRLYDLRHCSATLALSAGVAPKVISEQLGHARAGFTLDVYSLVLPHMQEAAAAKVEALLFSRD